MIYYDKDKKKPVDLSTLEKDKGGKIMDMTSEGLTADFPPKLSVESLKAFLKDTRGPRVDKIDDSECKEELVSIINRYWHET